MKIEKEWSLDIGDPFEGAIGKVLLVFCISLALTPIVCLSGYIVTRFI